MAVEQDVKTSSNVRPWGRWLSPLKGTLLRSRRDGRRLERLSSDVLERLTSGDLKAARRLAESAAVTRSQDADVADIRLSVAAYLEDHSHALELATRNARRHLDNLARARDNSKPRRTLAPHQRIFLSGHFYSGSGAVLDYLSDHTGTVKWSPAGEMRLIKSPGGMADIANRHSKTGALTTKDLVDHYLHITGRAITLTPRGVYHPYEKVNANSRRLFASPAARGYLHACLSGFLNLVELNSHSPSQTDLERHFRDCVTEALDAAATDTDADYLLIDQAINAWRLPLARFVPPSAFIVVHRDPRDNFAEAREVLSRPGRKATTADKYAKSYRNKQVKATSAIPDLVAKYGHRVLATSFEDFILRHDTAAVEVRRFVGFDEAAYRPAGFDVAVSRTNIGKYRTMTTPAEIATLASALPEFLHPDA